MKLSEQLQQIHDSGDVGYGVEGLAELAAELELSVREDELIILALEWYLRSRGGTAACEEIAELVKRIKERSR